MNGLHIVGFGFVARNFEGEVLAAATASLFDVFPPLIAEALCLRWAMSLATYLSVRRVCFDTECL